MADEIKVSLDLDIKNAIKGIEQFNKQAASSLQGLGKTIGFVKNAAVALAGAFALGKVVKEAMNADDAIAKLGIAMKLSGGYTKEALSDMEAFATKLQETTGFADDMTQSSLAMAKNFGLTNSESKKLVQTAADLAVVTGGSLEDATRQLTDSYSGQARTLAKLFPELRNYSEAQLKSGVALDVIRGRIGGTAEAMNNTFSGALKGVTNDFSDLMETMGQFVTQNPVIVEITKGLGSAIKGITSFLSSNKGGINDFINSLVIGFAGVLPTIISGIQLLVGSLGIVVKVLAMATIGAVEFVKALLNFAPIRALVQAIISGISVIVAGFLQLIDLILSIPGVGRTLKLAGFDVEDARKSLQSLTDTALDAVTFDQTGKIIQGLDSIGTAAAGSLGKVDDAVGSIGNSLNAAKLATKSFAAEMKKTANTSVSAIDTIKGPIAVVTEQAEKMRRAFEDLQQAMFQAGTQNPFNALMAAIGKGQLARQIADFEGKFGKLADKMQMLTGSAIAGVATAAVNGAEGARSLISGGAGAVADSYLPGSGQAVSAIVSALSYGPEKKAELESTRRQIAETEALIKTLEETALNRPLSMVEQAQLEQSQAKKTELEAIAKAIEEGNKKTITYQIRAFAKELPNIIRMIPSALKELIRELPSLLADLIPELVMAFIESIPDIIEGWITSGPRLIEGIFRGLGNLFAMIFGDGAKRFIDDLGRAILQIPEKIVQAIGKALEGLTGGLFKGGGVSWESVQNTITSGGLNLVADGLGIGGDVGKVLKDPVGSVKKIFGFASGGVVPPGFQNDSYPAMLTSGETVLPPPVSARFHDFMEKTESQASGSNDMSRMMSLLEELVSRDKSISVNIDGRQMADVIYSLNRKGYRTS